MRLLLFITLIVIGYLPLQVAAQQLPVQGNPALSSSVVDNHLALLGIDKDTGYPIYRAAPAQSSVPAAPAAPPAAPTNTPQPGDYGFSPIQDLRQLNF